MDPEEVKKAFAEGLKEFGSQVKGMIDGAIAPVNETVKGLSERLEKVEKTKIETHSAGFHVIPGKYKGYDLEEQGMGVTEFAVKHPGRFKVFSKPEKMLEFKKWMIDVVKALAFKDQASLASIQAKAAMAEGAPATGGALVPAEYQWDLIQLVREATFVMNKCTTLQMSSNSLTLPAEASLVTVAWTDEAGPISASDSTFGQVVLTAKKLAGLTTAMSNELLSDSAIDIVTMLTNQFAYAIAQELENQVLNGTGAPVSGMMGAKAGYSAEMATGSTSFSAVTADIFRSAMRKLSKVDQAKAEWAYSKDIQFYVDTLKDSQGRYIYREPGQGAGPSTLWGRPINESAKAPAESDSGTGKGCAVIGDWKQFYIGQRLGTMTLDVDPYSSFANDGTRFRLVSRWGLAPARVSAFSRVVTA